jgi:hypothetical protein
MCCESNRRAFWSVLSGFMLLSVSGYTQTIGNYAHSDNQ